MSPEPLPGRIGDPILGSEFAWQRGDAFLLDHAGIRRLQARMHLREIGGLFHLESQVVHPAVDPRSDIAKLMRGSSSIHLA